MSTKLNIGRLVADLGGPRHVAMLAGVPRTAPYRWIAKGYVASVILERLKDVHPELDLDGYFETT